MTTRTRSFALVAVVLAALFALGLCACGGSSGGDAFTGYTARDASSLQQIKDAAIELGKQRKEAPGDHDESTINSLAREAFDAANELYKNEKWAEATKAYEAIIADYPTHFGANVNLTLSMVQEEKGDEALKQALACVYLFPGSDGVLLNAQVAAADAQFSFEDLETTMSEITWEAEYDKSIDTTVNSGSLKDAYRYNSLWMRIETDLADSKRADMDDVELSSAYTTLHTELGGLLAAGMTNAEDGEQLMTYLEAVGGQLGVLAQ